MMTYRAGDLVSGGLTWTRPINLGGAQIQRNFSLRSDIVTKPLPAFSGSAAVPTTIEVYTQNTRTWSGQVAPGPFELVNLPVIAQSGEARVVLRDSQGRETVTELPFYSSDKLLGEGLLDFSIEAGFPRRGLGVSSSDYDESPFAILSARYGFSNWLTLEGHAEVGTDLANGGMGAVFLLKQYGAISLATAGSAHDERGGALASAAASFNWGDWTLYGRVQRTFGNYDDVASVSAHPARDVWGDQYRLASAPREIDQVSLAVPVPIDKARLQLSYARIGYDASRGSQVVGVNYSQDVWQSATLRTSLFHDFAGERNFGLYAGLSIALGHDISASLGYDYDDDRSRTSVYLAKSERPEAGSYGWRARSLGGDNPTRSASASYRSSFARFETTVTQHDSDVRATASADGALAFVGGGVFATQRLNDAFAVVDVGAPDVEVRAHNRLVGTTDRWGRVLVPNLHSYEANTIAIDPSNLPVDAAVPSTREVVVPAGAGGIVVKFGVSEQSLSALVGFVDPSGTPLKVGSIGRLDSAEDEFVIGYDGEAFLDKLAPANAVTIEGAGGKTCRAEFSYVPARGTQVRINGVICQ
ncbi:MAG: fimbria/pilus outer membrane usher protein [Hyphomicrobiaceae bacterium]